MTDAESQDRLVRRLIQKIRKHRDEIMDYQDYYLEKAKTVIVAYGSTARPALRAMRILRETGVQVGLLKLNTVWPFPENLIRDLAKKVDAFVVPEVNFGQIALEVERCSGGQALTELIPHAGGAIHNPLQIIEGVEKLQKKTTRKRHGHDRK